MKKIVYLFVCSCVGLFVCLFVCLFVSLFLHGVQLKNQSLTELRFYSKSETYN